MIPFSLYSSGNVWLAVHNFNYLNWNITYDSTSIRLFVSGVEKASNLIVPPLDGSSGSIIFSTGLTLIYYQSYANEYGIYYYKIQNDYLSLIRQEVISNPNLKIGNDFGNQSTATAIEYYFDPVNRNYVIREGSEIKFIICGERVLRYDFICISKTCTNKYCNDNCENSCNQPTVRKYYHYFGLRCIEAQYRSKQDVILTDIYTSFSTLRY